jgi:alpha-1,3-rhamnosyltransferase
MPINTRSGSVMPANPKVSICIPSYNHAPFLCAALDSALSQTYRNIEIIVADDGSTDDSLAIAESYAARHPALIRVLTHPGRRNLGVAATANLAFRESRGEYWSGLCSDDVLYPEKTEEEVKYLQRHQEVEWVYSYADYMDQNGETLPGLFGRDISNVASPLEILIVGNTIPAMTVMARRECFEKIGRERQDLVYSDWELWIRMAAHYRLGFIARSLVKYRIHDYNSSVGIESLENIRRGLQVLDSISENIQSYGGLLLEPRTRCLLDLQRARYLFCLGEPAAARAKLFSGFEIYSGLRNPRLLLDYWWHAHPLSEEKQEFWRWSIDNLNSEDSRFRIAAKRLKGLTFARAATESYKAGDLRNARRSTIKAQLADARWLCDRSLVSVLAESLIGSPAMKKVRKFKRWLQPEAGQNT